MKNEKQGKVQKIEISYEKAKNKLKKFFGEIMKRKDKRIKFVFVFGSVLTPRFNKLSDIDVCIYYDSDKKKRFNFLLNIKASSPDLDIHIFQDLPLFVRKEVLKGKL